MKRGKIITLTGASGAGKTSIARKLMEFHPLIGPVVSLTTRPPRSSDLPSEYQCITKERFEQLQKEDGFLWAVMAHGNYCGTLRSSMDSAILRPAPSFMILAPQTIPLLRDYVQSGGGTVLSFYILSSNEEQMRNRLKQRGEDDSSVERRVEDCKRWDEEAHSSGIPYIFVDNDVFFLGIERAARKILKHLGYDIFS